ncbi:MAG: T9SS type A sorting domain-containing protein [candidate division Zixibacteria bacterium]|nr:T9SS type A sorting domain-containing protein [candidate division Zixibacteria bacterium]
MRCHEARRRLTESVFAEDQNLQDHLRVCPACARQAKAALQLHQTLQAAAASDNAETIPWSEQMARVESRVALNKRTVTKETSIMTQIVNKLRIPRYSVSLGVAVVVLLLCTLVPFQFEQTVGYEVAFAGVDRNLALDSDRLSKLLNALGVEDASFDVGDCEATCKVKISELKTDKEVQLVLAAFDEIGNCVVEDVSEILGDKHTTLFMQARTIVVDGDDAESCESEMISQIVLHCLSELDSSETGEYTVWVSDEDGNIDYDVQIGNVDDFDGAFMFVGEGVGGCGDSGVVMETQLEITADEDGNMIAHITLPDGTVEVLDLSDPATAARLEELGLNMIVGGIGDLGEGEADLIVKKMIICNQDGDDGAAKQEADETLPDGFELSQNYPNPFNPTTTIDYTVPTSDHVTLDIYNVNGQLVKTLVDDVVSAGTHSVEWNATSTSGSRVASGMYFYRLTVGDVTQSKKMTLLK